MPKRTKLSPDEEEKFQAWYADIAEKSGIARDPDEPEHRYDYRGAYKAGMGPAPAPDDNNRLHWPSQFKDDDHPNRFINGVDTKTGKRKRPPTILRGE